jgi:Leucine-rich repeat (LRR) protein
MGHQTMKYIYAFLTVLILISCNTPKKDTEALPPEHVEDTPLTIPEAVPENITDKNDNTNRYTFRFSNGTYWDINDLTYFLSDTSIKSLRLYRGAFSDIGPLSELTELEELEITSNNYIIDISPISQLVNLKKLTFFNETYRGSIEALAALVNLEYLVLHYNDRYYKEIVHLQWLESLEISNTSEEGLDVSYIAQLHSLKKLEIRKSGALEGIINIERLKKLVNLEILSISPCNNIDISWITHLQKLRELELEWCTIDDISPLLGLPNLVSVNLSNSEVKDITPLLESKSIKTVSGPTEGLFYLFWERGIQYTGPYNDR